MENASKALIMAASVLLGIMLLSVLVYAFNQFSVFGTNYQAQLAAQEIEKLNNKFLIYDGREDLLVQDLINIAYLAKGENERNELLNYTNTNFYIWVNAYNGNNGLNRGIMGIYANQCTNFEKATDNVYYYAMMYIERGKYPSEETLRFTCTVEDPSKNPTKRVKKVTFTATTYQRWQEISPI